MSKPFQGIVNVDIRDSTPDWSPFEAPKAPPGAPNVIYIVLDDVGFSALNCYGGPVDTPNLDRIAPSLEVGFRHFPRLAMDPQLEPVLQQRLQHEHHLPVLRTGGRLGIDRVTINFDPFRAAHDLERLHIGYLDRAAFFQIVQIPT